MYKDSTSKYEKVQTKDKVIVALDVETAQEARAVIAELHDEVGAFKIGLQLFVSAGASFVRETVSSNIKIFLDLKFHDIPNTVSKAAIEAARLGVWMFNVHALGGSQMMQKTVAEVRDFCNRESLVQPKIIGVTILTSSDQKTLSEVGIETEINGEVLNLSELAAKCGLDGVVASPKEVKSIRENIENRDFLIVTPGIRNSNTEIETANPKTDEKLATNNDQKRVTSAGEAIRAGSDFLVIGRPILKAKDKILAVREIIKQIETS